MLRDGYAHIEFNGIDLAIVLMALLWNGYGNRTYTSIELGEMIKATHPSIKRTNLLLNTPDQLINLCIPYAQQPKTPPYSDLSRISNARSTVMKRCWKRL